MDTKEFYKSNNEFREYVDRYASSYNGRIIPVEEALTHALVIDYAKWIINRG